MYASYFGLTENPFNLTPDPRYLFLSQFHREALDHLLYGINEKKGFIVITGGIGTGKTTLCRALLNQLPASTKSALIFNTSISESEFLNAINREFGIGATSEGNTQKAQIDALNAFLLDTFKQRGNAVLVIDEAQNLTPSVLERIRLLSNLETDKEKLIQIVLAGQPELGGLLSAPSLKQLNERITVWYDLKPLRREDVQLYVDHRLAEAGNRGDLKFAKAGLRAVYGYSKGNPRRINAVCDRALLIAYCKDECVIGRTTVRKAIDDIQGDLRRRYNDWRVWLNNGFIPAALIMVLVFALASLGGWGFGRRLPRLVSHKNEVDVAQAESAAQAKPIIRRPVTSQQQTAPPERTGERTGERTSERTGERIGERITASTLSLDDRASREALFALFDDDGAALPFAGGDVFPSLFSARVQPDVARMFQKPFRVKVKAEPAEQALYLVVREMTTGGAIAVDSEGKERPVTNDVILAQWDGEVSWVYPYEKRQSILNRGMQGTTVSGVQEMLRQMGYLVEVQGIYDETTEREVMNFQRKVGLDASGVVDTQTKALLYQVSG